MWSKLIWSVAAVLAAALLAFVAVRTIAAYGDARYYAGLADGQLRQWPEILASHAAAAQNVVAERDRIIDAEVRHTTELARISALARRSDQELYAYAATATGRADCLDAERLRNIEGARAALFAASSSPADSESGPVSANPVAEGNKRGNE